MEVSLLAAAYARGAGSSPKTGSFVLGCVDHNTLATGGVSVQGTGAIRSSKAVANERFDRLSNRCSGEIDTKSIVFTLTHVTHDQSAWHVSMHSQDGIDAHASDCFYH